MLVEMPRRQYWCTLVIFWQVSTVPALSVVWLGLAMQNTRGAFWYVNLKHFRKVAKHLRKSVEWNSTLNRLIHLESVANECRKCQLKCVVSVFIFRASWPLLNHRRQTDWPFPHRETDPFLDNLTLHWIPATEYVKCCECDSFNQCFDKRTAS